MPRTPELNPLAQRAVRVCYREGVGTQEELGQLFRVSRFVIQRTLSHDTLAPDTKKEQKGND
jgi:hypothetical protein